MKILVCLKQVPHQDARLDVNADGSWIKEDGIKFEINSYDTYALEEALRIKDAGTAEVFVVSIGPERVTQALRTALGMGADRAIHLVSDGEEWDPQATAGAIVDAIRADETANGPFDLVLFGNESADAGNYQVGIRVAYALSRPVATGLKGVSVEGATARCEQEAAGGRDVYELPLPAVLGVLEGLNLPRYPSVPAKLRAQRKPIESSSPTRPDPELEKVRLVVPEGQGKEALVLGQGPEAAPAVVAILQQIGVA